MSKRSSAPKTLSRGRKAVFTRKYNQLLKSGKTTAYARRIASAEARGKSRQLARGHKLREHVIRKEKERARQGVTNDEIRRIKKFYRERFNPHGYKEVPTEHRLIEWAQEHGYDAFVAYRKKWDAVRRNYESQARSKKYVPQGEAYLDDLLDDLEIPVDNELWFYYH